MCLLVCSVDSLVTSSPTKCSAEEGMALLKEALNHCDWKGWDGGGVDEKTWTIHFLPLPLFWPNANYDPPFDHCTWCCRWPGIKCVLNQTELLGRQDLINWQIILLLLLLLFACICWYNWWPICNESTYTPNIYTHTDTLPISVYICITLNVSACVCATVV